MTKRGKGRKNRQGTKTAAAPSAAAAATTAAAPTPSFSSTAAATASATTVVSAVPSSIASIYLSDEDHTTKRGMDKIERPETQTAAAPSTSATAAAAGAPSVSAASAAAAAPSIYRSDEDHKTKRGKGKKKPQGIKTGTAPSASATAVVVAAAPSASTSLYRSSNEDVIQLLKAAFQSVPVEELCQILSRLPVKSLVSFMAVSKTWCALIMDQRFVYLHHNQSAKKLFIHVPQIDWVVSDPEQPPKQTRTGHLLQVYNPGPRSTIHTVLCPDADASSSKEVDVVGSVNGLFLWVEKPWAKKLILWNPALRFAQPIPSPDIQNPDSIYRMVSTGLAFDACTNDLKVILVLCCYPRCDMPEATKVYSLKPGWQGRWRIANVPAEVFRLYKSYCEVIVKGVPYWRAFVYGNSRVLPIKLVLVRFDVQQEVLTEVKSPEISRDTCLTEIFSNLGIVVCNDKMKGQLEIVVWVLHEDVGNEWNKIYKVQPISLGKIISFCADRVVVEVVGDEGNLLMYDVEKEEVADIVNFEQGLSTEFNVLNYRESLEGIRATQYSMPSGAKNHKAAKKKKKKQSNSQAGSSSAHAHPHPQRDCQ